jgi:hypothetical protein
MFLWLYDEVWSTYLSESGLVDVKILFIVAFE